jgi:hypothetical protein
MTGTRDPRNWNQLPPMTGPIDIGYSGIPGAGTYIRLDSDGANSDALYGGAGGASVIQLDWSGGKLGALCSLQGPHSYFNMSRTGHGNANWMRFYANGSSEPDITIRPGRLRWVLQPGDEDPEFSGNSGSNFSLYRHDDNGQQIGRPLRVVRSTGEVLLERDPVSVLGAATKQYTDAHGSGATAPANPIEGQLWWNSSTKQMNVYDGTHWVPL